MKRMLALDGGVIRGVFAIAILERIEEILRDRFCGGKENFVLADFFDFIRGTSTGAIITAILSRVKSVQAIREIATSGSGRSYSRETRSGSRGILSTVLKISLGFSANSSKNHSGNRNPEGQMAGYSYTFYAFPKSKAQVAKVDPKVCEKLEANSWFDLPCNGNPSDGEAPSKRKDAESAITITLHAIPLLQISIFKIT